MSQFVTVFFLLMDIRPVSNLGYSVNTTGINILVQVFCGYMFSLVLDKYLTWNFQVMGCMCKFNSIRHCQTIFSNCTLLPTMYAYFQCKVVFYCALISSLRTSNVEHPFICSGDHITSFSKCLLKWLVHFSVGLCLLVAGVVGCASYTLHTNISFVVGNVNIFFQSLTCLLIFLTSFG